ncbi:hypothetical protein HJG53_16755 [Sphingomonas sp. ID1715]|uniref:hypothetical protein n=1 Tax=Sphingomonas sp. ID1715 TaxID=1656898 RepID=UPI0014898D8D|nr:hypothetical protein [Sphingomonas sp. ID1715]NNM78539.1 hypothetical protein [Sphingomonas sp. ID1715]
MLIGGVEATLEWSDLVAVRLLRRWAICRGNANNPLPRMVELAKALGVSPEAAVALASLFQLTEGCLSRALHVESCLSGSIGSDERAVLLLIASAPEPGRPLASETIPHGLSGALAWAAWTVRRLLGDPGHARGPIAPVHCPFTPA